MGEVFRARDTRLARDVALKVLPEAFLQDTERLARFEREAKVLASLNHPNIAAIYGIEEDNGRRALALELVEGQDLSEKISNGAMPVREALGIAHQIAVALDVAHEQGIIHRDLKPGNIMITPDGTAKVLDFGLAKALDPDKSGANLTQSPTIVSAATSAGVILGTAAYMSPEQARGKELDKRTDIWSFGCVLYEMLTGRQSHAGETVSDTIAFVLGREPDWNALPSGTPVGVRRILERCLQKDLKRRLRDIGDAVIELEETVGGTGAASGPGSAASAVTGRAGRRSRGWLWLLTGVVIGAAVTAMVLSGRNRVSETSGGDVSRFELNPLLPVAERTDQYVDISPDGRRIAYVGVEDNNKLCVRDLADETFRVLDGTDFANNPKFSPDGRWILFTGGGKLKKIAIDEEAPVILQETGEDVGNGWLPDGRITFTPTMTGGLFVLPSGGGRGTEVARPDTTDKQFGVWWPHVLPDGRRLLYTAWRTRVSDTDIRVVDLETGETRLVLEGAARSVYTKSGHLLFTRGSDVMAARFDADAATVLGDAVPVLRNVNIRPANGDATYAVSHNGTLAYLEVPEPRRRIVWIDMKGAVHPLMGEKMHFDNIELSGDARRIAAVVYEPDGVDIFVGEVARGVMTKVTFDGGYNSIAWMADGSALLAGNLDRGPFELYVVPADGSSDKKLFYGEERSDLSVYDIATTGGDILFSRYAGDVNQQDLHVLDPDARQVRPVAQTPGDESYGIFSPDGKWVAYASERGKTSDVFVQTVAPGGGRHQVSVGGGARPQWSADGRYIYFLNAGTMFVVEVTHSPQFSIGPQRALFSNNDLGGELLDFVLHPDGDRFVAALSDGEVNMQPIKVVLNWFEELNRLLPPVD